MNSEHDTSGTDEYFVTALQIFEYCGGESTGTLRVDALMDKFAPFVKTDKAEFKQLRSLLDPDHCNPEISVTRLANSLHAYSESQKTKMDLDESFNLRCGQMPQDSDSGISTDGFQLLEELQSELREKAHLAATLRGRLDAADRHHEEALQALTAERDELRAHLHVLREENASLSAGRGDYEEAVERAETAERALAEARRDLDAARAKDRAREERLEELEIERQRLTELASQSTAECHRMNAMYAARQAALLEDNEALRAARADLAAKLADHDQFVQQIINEKVLLEMELKEAVNKSNQTHSRLERSIDVSYTDDHMLTELDTLNADTRFEPDHASISTQVNVPCVECEMRRAVVPQRSLRRYLWEPLKCLFQVFAVVCFICAVSVLYGVTRRWNARCDRDVATVPWRWFDAQDVLDLLLRIEYVADVPM